METEYWEYDAGTDSVALLVIPGALTRTRVFDIDVTLVVRVPASGRASHSLSVEVDGRRLWGRRVDSHNPGDTDGLEYHHRLTLAPGPDCRVRARAETQGTRVAQLRIEAREVS